jgi:hypothetical protein
MHHGAIARCIPPSNIQRIGLSVCFIFLLQSLLQRILHALCTHQAMGKAGSELPSYKANAEDGRTKSSHSRRRMLAVGYIASFTAGWVLAGGRGSSFHVVTRAAKQKSTEHLNKPYAPISLSHILSQRPNWRRDYELQDWLPLWLSKETVAQWKARRHDRNHQRALDVEMKLGRDDYFWKTMVDPRNFTFAIANNGFGHRLGNLAMSYLCNVVPNKRQQIIFWDTPGKKLQCGVACTHGR